MSPKFFAFLMLVTTAVRLTADTEEEKLRKLSDDLDRAVAGQDLPAVTALLNEHYVYTEPDVPERNPDGETLAARAAYRLSRDRCWSDQAPTVRITGDTAIITGKYRVLHAEGTFRASPTGWFTSTWTKTGGTWTLLAEHRSLNLATIDFTQLHLTVSPSRPTPQVVAPAKPAQRSEPALPPGAPTLDTTAEAGPAALAGAAAPATTAETREQSSTRQGTVPLSATNLFRAYEPNSVGYTYDEGDDAFLDFTFSAMFPLLPNQPYPPQSRELVETNLFRRIEYHRPYLYFAATLRGSQYIGTRPSSPVVGKRFNPLVSARFWAHRPKGKPESEDNFLEFYYAHESNGQFIASPERFRQQLRVYLEQEMDATNPDDPEVALRRAYRSARDNISRGWDYVGVQFGRDWDATPSGTFRPPWLKGRAMTMGLRAKFNYFLKEGLMQGDAEEYNAWEHDPEGKPRNQVDGISLRYTFVVAPKAGDEPGRQKKPFRFERRYAFTWTTGYVDPFRYNTYKAEGSMLLFDTLPLTFWGRYGYNSDLVDYYRKDYSVGISLSFWDY